MSYNIRFEILVIVILVIATYFLWISYTDEGFSLSKKPMDHDGAQVGSGPFDNIDYHTPRWYPAI